MLSRLCAVRLGDRGVARACDRRWLWATGPHASMAFARTHGQSPVRALAVPVQRRALTGWLRQRIAARVSEEADRVPEDARAQAACLEALVAAGDHEAVVERFEDVRLARDASCWRAYVSALHHLGVGDRLSALSENAKSAVGGAHRPSARAEGTAERLAALGTRSRPLYVQGLGGERGGAGSRAVGVINALVFASIAYGVWSASRTAGPSPGFPGGVLGTKAHRLAGAEDVPPTTFADVQGCDEAKAELAEVVDFLRSPERYARLGARMPRGVLLVGPPGAGKTLLARALAGEAHVPFFYAAGSQFDEVFVGVGSGRVRAMFEAARAAAPSIVFIDEIDALASRRSARDPQHARMSLNQLLTELDGFASGGPPVVVVAATNLPDALDPALLRPGRFDRHVTVGLPDVRGRRQILELYLGPSRTPGAVDVGDLARATPGMSGAELFKLVNTARIRAAHEGASRVERRHIDAARDEMVLGAERRSAVVPQADRVLTAFHEGGHALVAMATPDALPVHKATIVPRGSALGLVAQLPDSDELSVTRAQLLARLDVAMAGRAAEALVFGPARVTTGAASDFAAATAIARAMVARFGMSDALGALTVRDDAEYAALSSETRASIDAEIRALLGESAARVDRVLAGRRDALERIAHALLDRETLTRAELEDLYAGRPLPAFDLAPVAAAAPSTTHPHGAAHVLP